MSQNVMMKSIVYYKMSCHLLDVEGDVLMGIG